MPPGTTIRIDRTTHATLRQLKAETGRPIGELLSKAVERFQEELILAKMNAAYAELRADEEAWRQEQAEREAWDATLADGLEAD